MSKSTAIFPSKYYFEEMERIDPRFYDEKAVMIVVPYELQEAPTPEDAFVFKTSVTSKSLMLSPDDLMTPEEISDVEKSLREIHEGKAKKFTSITKALAWLKTE